MPSKCEICGAALGRWQKFTCSRECSTKRSRKQYYIKSERPAPEKWQPKAKKRIETDADQARIKRELDAKYGMGHSPCRTIERDSDEWNEIVKTIQPLHRIAKRHAMPPLAPSKANYGGLAA